MENNENEPTKFKKRRRPKRRITELEKDDLKVIGLIKKDAMD